MVIPDAWKRLDMSSMSGVLMVLGAPDVGKSTFARYLYHRLISEGKRAAFLDGDPGQSLLGPPTTITLAIGQPGESQFPPSGELRRWFIGSVTPSGHMLQVLVGAKRLVQAAFELGVDVVVYDTSGLVDPVQGGQALKQAKIDLLHPAAIYAIQSGDELEPLLTPLRRSMRSRVIDLAASPGAKRRDVTMRQAHRAKQFEAYFRNASQLSLNWTRLSVFPSPRFALEGLVSFDDAEGFSRELGIVTFLDRKNHTMILLTPLSSLEGIGSIKLGDTNLDRDSFRDYRV
jgi:polynucleotide 5'-hydroxyl-kinase GRC3/NOL9